jgi:hypothetical protein
MNSSPNYYKHSGRVPPASVALALVGGLLSALIVGFLYGQGMARIPVVGKITFVIAAAAGAAYGAVPALLFRKGHGRSTPVGAGIAALCTVVGHYVAWAAWVSVVLNRDTEGPGTFDLVLSPGDLWETIDRISEVGAWSLRSSSPVTGGVLWGLWALEGLIVLGVGAALGGGLAMGGVYCEHCGRWCKEEEGRVMLNPAPPEAVKPRLEAQDFAVLNEIGPLAQDGPALRLDLAWCEGCDKTHAVALSKLTPKADGSGTDSESVLPHLHTTPEVSRWLRSIPARAG